MPTGTSCSGRQPPRIFLNANRAPPGDSAMITLYQYLPAWTVPCISPYVTKVAYYMTMAGLKFDTKPQDLTRLDKDTPAGKLPCIVDTDGTTVNDSTHILQYLQG